MAIWCSRDAISITKIDICIYCIYKNQIYNSKIWSKGTQIHKQYTKMKSHTHPSGSNPHTFAKASTHNKDPYVHK